MNSHWREKTVSPQNSSDFYFYNLRKRVLGEEDSEDKGRREVTERGQEEEIDQESMFKV